MRRKLKSRASSNLSLGVEMARNSLQLTKMELADRVGCSAQHVTDIERQQRNPSQLLITQLADALGKTPAELYQLGEIQLELKTLEFVRERRRRVQIERDLKAMIGALDDLDKEDVSTLIEAARKALDR